MSFKYALEGLLPPPGDYIQNMVLSEEEVNQCKHDDKIILHRPFSESRTRHEDDLVYIPQLDDKHCFIISGILYNKNKVEIILTLNLTKYEMPYTLEMIKTKYGQEIYDKLSKDPCHAWRAKTGIELIHLEPTETEQKRIHNNWLLMPEKYRKVSDYKSFELFGYTNLNHEKMLVIDKIRMILSKINYGLRDPSTDKGQGRFNGISTTNKDFIEKWRLGTPDETIKAQCGNCYDTVAISREYLSKSPIKFCTFYVTTESAANTHTFIIYQDCNGIWKWLEGSWDAYKNNKFESKNPNELARLIATLMMNSTKQSVQLFELSKYPPYGCDIKSFEQFCMKQKYITSLNLR